MICVKSSANEDPAKDYNEWIQHVYSQVKINYERKLNNIDTAPPKHPRTSWLGDKRGQLFQSKQRLYRNQRRIDHVPDALGIRSHEARDCRIAGRGLSQGAERHEQDAWHDRDTGTQVEIPKTRKKPKKNT